MIAVYGSQSTPRMLLDVFTLFFLQWLLQWSTKQENHPNNTNSQIL